MITYSKVCYDKNTDNFYNSLTCGKDTKDLIPVDDLWIIHNEATILGKSAINTYTRYLNNISRNPSNHITWKVSKYGILSNNENTKKRIRVIEAGLGSSARSIVYTEQDEKYIVSFIQNGRCRRRYSYPNKNDSTFDLGYARFLTENKEELLGLGFEEYMDIRFELKPRRIQYMTKDDAAAYFDD